MQVLRRLRPSPAMIVALIALFVALGGTAAALSGSNTVFSDDVVNGQVKTADLADSAVTGKKVKDNSVGPGDLDSTIAEPHGDADVSTAGPGVSVAYPLSNATWTQPAGEVQIITGTVTYRTPPGTCLEFGDPNTFGHAELDLKLAGAVVGGAYLAPLPQNTIKTTRITVAPQITGGGGPAFLFGPTANTSRTLSTQIKDFCDDDNFVVQSVDIDVVGVG